MLYYKIILELANFRKNAYGGSDKMLAVANFAVDSNSIAKCVIRTTREPEVSNNSAD